MLKQNAVLTTRDLGFRYPSTGEPCLDGVSLTIFPGECILLTGPTGCGKSTLLKAISGIIPHASSGEMKGKVLIRGIDSRTCSLPDLAETIGLVFQSPDDQLVCEYVADELAFGLENLGLEPSIIEQRVEASLARVGLEGVGENKVADLSGGQKQRVAIAAQIAMGAPILALDEPISQLDPAGAREVMDCLGAMRQKGLTIVLVEHRLSEALRIATRVVVMDKGRIVLDCASQDIGRHQDLLTRLGLEVPAGLRLAKILDVKEPRIPAVETIASTLATRCAGLDPPGYFSTTESVMGAGGTAAVLEVRDLSFTYPDAGKPALQNISFSLREGDVLALMGKNGSGKSSLLSVLAGLLKPGSGKIVLGGKGVNGRRKRRLGIGNGMGILFQNPDLFLIRDSVLEEVVPGFLGRGMSVDQARRAAMDFLGVFGLKDLSHLPPWSVSRGQRLQTCLAAVLSPGPRVLLLDEPTTGQNRENILNIGRLLKSSETLQAMVLCSHDLDAVCRHATHLALIDQGQFIAYGPLREVLSEPEALARAGVIPHFALALSYATQTRPPLVTTREWIKVCAL